MAIDASIPLSVKPPQVDDPAESYGRVLSLRNMMQQGALHQQQMQENALQMQRQQDAIKADRDLAELIQQHSAKGPDGSISTDHDAITIGLAGRGHGALSKQYEANARADAKSVLENHGKELANYESSLKVIGSLTNPVVDAATGYGDNTVGPDGNPVAPKRTPAEVEAAWQGARQQALAAKLPGVDKLPPTLIGPDGSLDLQALAAVRGNHSQAITAQEHAAAARSDLDFGHKILQYREQVAENAPKTEKAWLEYSAGLLGSAQNEAQYTHALQTVAAKAPKSVVSQFDATFSPDAAKHAAELGMSPEQRESNKMRQDAAEQRKSYEADMLGIRRDALDLRRELAENAKPKKPTAGQFLSIESKKTALMRKAEDVARKRITDGETWDAVLPDLDKDKQFAQDAYEADLQAIGTPVEHLEYPLTQPTPKAAPAGAAPTAPPVAAPAAVAPAAPVAAPAPAAAPTASKVFPRAKLKALADANGITPSQAEGRLRGQGYKIQ